MKEILYKLINNGFDAYIVGGYVREYLLHKNNFDIDISTNAKPYEIDNILNHIGKINDKYYAYHFSDGLYNYDITTFRKELKYEKNKPIKLEYSNFKEDILRRDFTINAIAMDKDNNIIDIVGGINDLNNHIIRVIGSTYEKLNEDATRVLRALRFYTTLNFELDLEIINFINDNKNIFNNIPKEYIRQELDKIFSSKYVYRFFDFISKYNLFEYLHIKYDRIDLNKNVYGLWAQIETDLPFSKCEKDIIKSIKDVNNYE